VTRPHEDQGNEAHDLRDSLADSHSSSLLRVRFDGFSYLNFQPVNVRMVGYLKPSNRNQNGLPVSSATLGSCPATSVKINRLGYENPSNRNEYGSPDSPATSGSYPEYLVKVKRLRPITPIRRLLTPQPSFSSVPRPMV